MVSMILAAAFWIALHFLVAGPVRPALAARLGEAGFRGVFSVLSAAGLAWLIFAFRAAPYVALWPPLPGMRYVALVLVFLAFVFFPFSIGAANPTLAGADMLLKDRLPVQGMTRITRLPASARSRSGRSPIFSLAAMSRACCCLAPFSSPRSMA